MSTENITLNAAHSKPQNPVLNVLFNLTSIVFHPLFLPTYFFMWVYFRFPYSFPGLTETGVKLRMFGVFWTTAFFPAFVVFLLWRLKAVNSMKLQTYKERIIPYITTMFFYWWMWYLSRNFTDQSQVLKFFYFGIFIATIPGLILNNFIKISMHGMGIGGILAAMVISCSYLDLYLGQDLIIAFILGGLILTARMYLKEHSSKELYTGFAVGIATQIISYYIFK